MRRLARRLVDAEFENGGTHGRMHPGRTSLDGVYAAKHILNHAVVVEHVTDAKFEPFRDGDDQVVRR